MELAREIVNRPRCKYSLIGTISETPDMATAYHGTDCLGSMQDLALILEMYKPVHIIVAPDRMYAHLPMDRLVESQIRYDVSVETGVQAYEKLTGKLAIEALTTGAILFSSDFNPSRFMHVFSRCISLVTASLGFVLFLPVMAIVALAVRLDSPGPVLFVQERTGLGGKPFKLLKFRSMTLATGKHTEWAEDNAERITRTGKWLRKFRLDELPQFINVIRGDMNLIGPRPHPSSNHDLITLVSRNTQLSGEQIPYYSLRSSVRPGITGWAQVRYKYANGIDEEIEKLRYDLYYIKHYTPFLDMQILYQTVGVVLFGHLHQGDAQYIRQNTDQSRSAAPQFVSIQPEVSGIDATTERERRQGRVVNPATGNARIPYTSAKHTERASDRPDNAAH